TGSAPRGCAILRLRHPCSPRSTPTTTWPTDTSSSTTGGPCGSGWRSRTRTSERSTASGSPPSGVTEVAASLGRRQLVDRVPLDLADGLDDELSDAVPAVDRKRLGRVEADQKHLELVAVAAVVEAGAAERGHAVVEV